MVFFENPYSYGTPPNSPGPKAAKYLLLLPFLSRGDSQFYVQKMLPETFDPRPLPTGPRTVM